MQYIAVSVLTVMSRLEAMKQLSTNYIIINPEWELVGIYVNDGISGTNTKKRERFNEMLDDCVVAIPCNE